MLHAHVPGSSVKLLFSVTTYDEDEESGYISLYNLLEWIRFKLLSNSPIDERWNLQDSLETAINSSGDVMFTATAEFHSRLKRGEKIKF